MLGLGKPLWNNVMCCMSSNVLINSFRLFLSQALYDLIVEVVFPICAIFLLPDEHISNNAANMSALKSGKTYREKPENNFGTLVTGSEGEGLTLHMGWGHPWPDCDMMILFGEYLGVNIPKNQFRKCQSLQSSSSEGCHCNSFLEYVPEGCPPAFAKIRVTDIMRLKTGNTVTNLSRCLDLKDGHIWLNTARLCHLIMQYFNKDFGDKTPLGKSTGVSGPAGQVMYKE